MKRERKEKLREEEYGAINAPVKMKNGRRLKPIKKYKFEELAKDTDSEEETLPHTPRMEEIDEKKIMEEEVTRKIRAEMKARVLKVDASQVFSP